MSDRRRTVHGMSDSSETVNGSGDEVLGAKRDDSENAAAKDPSEWVTGDEPMTAPQRSYLDTLAREAGEEIPADLSKAQASTEIDRLQQETGRGQN
jgi:hydrogenase maturation factor HypF (carbamoyltransferase family)